MFMSRVHYSLHLAHGYNAQCRDRNQYVCSLCYNMCGQAPFVVTDETVSRFLSVLPTYAKVLLFAPEAAPWEEKKINALHTQVKDAVMMGVVHADVQGVRKRFGIEDGESCLVLVSRLNKKEVIRYDGDISAEWGQLGMWLRHFCWAPGLVLPVTKATYPYFVSHIPAGMPAVLFLKAYPSFLTGLSQSMPSVAFAHCAANDVAALQEHLQLEGDEAEVVVVPSAATSTPVPYSGVMQPPAVKAFLDHFIVDPRRVMQLTGHNLDTFFHKEPARPKILLFSSHLGTPQLYRDLHKQHGKEAWFGIVNQQPEVEQRFQVNRIPSLMAFRRTGNSPLQFNGKVAAEDVSKWLTEFMETVTPE